MSRSFPLMRWHLLPSSMNFLQALEAIYLPTEWSTALTLQMDADQRF